MDVVFLFLLSSLEDSSMVMGIAVVDPFSLLYCIPSYEYTTTYLSLFLTSLCEALVFTADAEV